MEPRRVEYKTFDGNTIHIGDGIFHQWTSLSDRDEVYAIIEKEDGTVIKIYSDYIKFLPPSPQVKLEWEETIIEDSYDAFVPGINEHVFIDKNYTGWKLTFDPLELSSEKLKAKDLEEAKAEAIELIRKRINDLKKAFENIIP